MLYHARVTRERRPFRFRANVCWRAFDFHFHAWGTGPFDAGEPDNRGARRASDLFVEGGGVRVLRIAVRLVVVCAVGIFPIVAGAVDIQGVTVVVDPHGAVSLGMLGLREQT